MKKLIIWNWVGALIQNLLEHIIKHADRSSLAQSWCGRSTYCSKAKADNSSM